jgi:DNA-binding LacI/PurR family transcriptional regulator
MTGIKQLARHLGVSIGTVSRALNNRPDVNEQTRRRVLEGAAHLGYAPNQSGRSLRQGVTNTIGLVLEVSAARAMEGDSYFPRVISHLQRALEAHQLDLVLLPSQNEPDYLQRMVARRFVDAVIISETRRMDPRIEFLIRSGLPFVSFGRSLSGKGYAWVDLDFGEGTRNAVARLVAKGHRRIAATVPDNGTNYGYLFLEGYRKGLSEHGIAYDEDLVFRVKPGEEGGVIAASRILSMADKPTAILLKHDLSVFGLYSTLLDGRIYPGKDIAVISFGDSPQIQFLRPSLTTYSASLDDVANTLALTLLRVLRRQPMSDDAPLGHLCRMTVTEGASDDFCLMQ